MNFKIFIACVLTVARAEYLNPSSGSYVTQAYYQGRAGANYVYQPQIKSEYVPVIKDGVPVDTPEVQQAKAEHFALYAKAAAATQAARASSLLKQQAGQYQDESYQQAYYPATTTNQYNAAPQGGNSYIYQSGGHLSNSGAYYAQQPGPVDTAEVQQAKAAHYIALERAAVRAATPSEHYRHKRNLGTYSLLQHVPLITKDGVPVETPEVQVAKAQHLLAHAKAKAQGSGYYGESSDVWTNYGTPEVNKVQYSVSHNYGGWQPYTGPIHYPVIDKDGVPVETPEVQIAKQQHFLAHSQAKLGGLYTQAQLGSYYGSSYPHANITPDGVPEETPEVKIAKAQHFAAHAEEQVKHAKWAGQLGSSYTYETNSHY